VRTTISLPDALLENAKQYAAERRTTLSALLEDALRRQLALHPPSSASRFRLHTVRGKLVNPNLDLDRNFQRDALDDQAQFKQK
jgi:Ribbon-helix-helix protein, copG family